MSNVAQKIFEKNNISVDVKIGLSEEEIIKIIPEYEGMVVRSATKVTKNIILAAKNLKVIGRAGAGVFYTVTLLPDFWQTLSRLNPILYMVNSMRYSVLGTSDIEIMDGLLMIGGFFILLLSVAVYLLKKGIGIRD